MAKDKLKTVYVCTECGEVSPRWLGKCPSCGEWNTLVEDVISEPASGGKAAAKTAVRVGGITASPLAGIHAAEDKSRIITGIAELDRVLGGGIVLGSVVLLGGEPGAGKSTLLLQLCGAVGSRHRVLYITGEESARQIKLRALRLQIEQDNIDLAAESDIDGICALIEEQKPEIVVIDSIQTMYTADITSAAGSVSQVKECAARLLKTAKRLEIPTFIVGHVNKDGALAGPKVMEHIVDTVLYFEGDKRLPYRILRAVKNRYGSTNEIGMFDMTNKGLRCIENPSKMFLDGRNSGASGSCVTSTVEGSRTILSEVQALVTKSGFAAPRRAGIGIDYNRLNLLLAVLEKRAGYNFGTLDVYVNIVGGLELDDTAGDLAVCLAMISALTDQPLPEDVLVAGEVGLGGEIRNVSQIENRVREARRMGFSRAVIPQQCLSQISTDSVGPIKLEGVKKLQQAFTAVWPAK